MIYVIKWLPLQSEFQPQPQPKFSHPFPDAQAALDWAEDNVHGAEGVDYWDFITLDPKTVVKADRDWLESLITQHAYKELYSRTYVVPSQNLLESLVRGRVEKRMKLLELEG